MEATPVRARRGRLPSRVVKIACAVRSSVAGVACPAGQGAVSVLRGRVACAVCLAVVRVAFLAGRGAVSDLPGRVACAVRLAVVRVGFLGRPRCRFRSARLDGVCCPACWLWRPLSRSVRPGPEGAGLPLRRRMWLLVVCGPGRGRAGYRLGAAELLGARPAVGVWITAGRGAASGGSVAAGRGCGPWSFGVPFPGCGRGVQMSSPVRTASASTMR